MLDHIGLQVQDVEKSLDFYLGTFAAIGMREIMRFSYGETIVVGLGGADGQPVFWLGPPTGTETRELHVAFKAPDRAAVDAVHQAAVAAGVEVLHAPREFPEYHPATTGCSCATWTATTSRPSTTARPPRARPPRPALTCAGPA